MSTKKAPKIKKSKVEEEEEEYDYHSTISFMESQLPKDLALEVGKNNTLTIEVQLVSERIEDYGDKKGKKCYTFVVNKLSKSV